jgi:hypothetical protein
MRHGISHDTDRNVLHVIAVRRRRDLCGHNPDIAIRQVEMLCGLPRLYYLHDKADEQREMKLCLRQAVRCVLNEALVKQKTCST